MLYSIRMRASQGGPHEEGGRHISGAERILPESGLPEMAKALVERALHHSKGKADFIRLTIDGVDDDKTAVIPALKIETYEASDSSDGHAEACRFLQSKGISETAVEKALQFLLALPENMRGAALFDAQSGERLDDTGMRGIRVTKMDFKDQKKASSILNQQGLTNIHLHEAIVLASKVLSAPHVLGELCWSDDPDYIVGYVSAQGIYHRITKMKPMYSDKGGRVFFIDNAGGRADIAAVRQYLEEQVVLVDLEKKDHD